MRNFKNSINKRTIQLKMREDYKQALFQRNLNSQQISEKKLNFISCQEMQVKTHNKISSHLIYNDYYQKDEKQQMQARMWRKDNSHTQLVGM
jgi:hypothetical protein